MKKLAIIHTSPATVEPLKVLAAELLPGCPVVNFIDDSILPQLAQNGGDLRAVQGRLKQYACFAQEVGATAILEACSSVGEVVEAMQQQVSIPVVRIDEAMAETAVRRGRRIGVAATLATTLNPTTRLLQAKAQALGKPIEIKPMLIEGAFDRLMAGDKEGHVALLIQALNELTQETDIGVLAQATMARVLPKLSAAQDQILTSPRLGMERVRAVLEG